MKTTKRIILIVFLILLIAIVALGIWQRENIKAFINSIKYSEEEISQMLDDNNKKMDDIVEKTEYIDVRKGGLTPEEQTAVANGEITQEEAIEIIRGKTTLEEIREEKKSEPADSSGEDSPADKTTEKAPSKPTEKETDKKQDKEPDKATNKEPDKKQDKEPSKPADKNTDKKQDKEPDKTTTKNPDKTTDKTTEKEPDKTTTGSTGQAMTDEVSNIVAQLYLTKDDFIARLEGIGQQMYTEYTQVARYDRSQINAIIQKYTPTVGKLERECDTKINGLLEDLKTALTKGGGDLSLVDEIRQYYYNEKSLKKSYYFDQIAIGTSD